MPTWSFSRPGSRRTLVLSRRRRGKLSGKRFATASMSLTKQRLTVPTTKSLLATALYWEEWEETAEVMEQLRHQVHRSLPSLDSRVASQREVTWSWQCSVTLCTWVAWQTRRVFQMRRRDASWRTWEPNSQRCTKGASLWSRNRRIWPLMCMINPSKSSSNESTITTTLESPTRISNLLSRRWTKSKTSQPDL